MPLEHSEHAMPSRRTLRIAAFSGLALVIVVVSIGIATRALGNAKLRKWTEARAVATVTLVRPSALAADSKLKLPGRIEAYSRAPIYARVAGYLKAYYVDIGSPVKAGQLLAQIESPDLDQQFAQARADLANAQANEALAGTTYKRWAGMLDTDSVAKQEVDEKKGDLESKQAIVKAARANVDRLAALINFKRIVAPFDGIVTARATDVGALINAGSSSGAELFTVSDTHKLRVYISVPQTYARDVRKGMTAQLSVPERPGENFTATVESTSQAVNAESGALLVQLSIENKQGELLPGGYAEVQLTLGSQIAAVNVPASALIFDAAGLHVATVDANHRIVMKPVRIGLDQGKTVQIASGLTLQEQIIDSPPDALVQGEEVRIAAPATDSGHART